MITDRTPEYLIGLVHELRKLPTETEWLEFKHNDAEPQKKRQRPAQFILAMRRPARNR